MINPQDNISFKRILNIPNRKIGKTSIEHLDEYAILHQLSLTETLEGVVHGSIDIKLTPAAKEGGKKFFELIDEMKTALPKSTPAQLIEKLLSKLDYKNYLIKEE